MKEIPVIISIGSTRLELISQTLQTLFNTKYPHKLYIFGSNRNPVDHVVIKNQIIKTLRNYEFVVLVDDDVCLNKGWLEYLITTHQKYPDVDILEATANMNEKIIEDRGDVVIADKIAGPCCSIRKRVFDVIGKLPERRIWTKGIEDYIAKKNGKMARLKDQTKVVHCGVIRSDGYRYADNIRDYFRNKAEKVGAIIG